MEYDVREIANESEIDQCTLFHIDQYNWGGDYRPNTYGKMGYIRKEGFYIKITCEERDPARVYTNANDPVYLDSAIEAFLCFGNQECNGIEKPYYMNFEMNANGAMLASIGCERTNRLNLSEDLRAQIVCTPTVTESSWGISLYIPVTVIRTLYSEKIGEESPDCPDAFDHTLQSFTCNFFKLKESKGETQHFASFSPIDYPEPNFHLPQFFAHCRILHAC